MAKNYFIHFRPSQTLKMARLQQIFSAILFVETLKNHCVCSASQLPEPVELMMPSSDFLDRTGDKRNYGQRFVVYPRLRMKFRFKVKFGDAIQKSNHYDVDDVNNDDKIEFRVSKNRSKYDDSLSPEELNQIYRARSLSKTGQNNHFKIKAQIRQREKISVYGRNRFTGNRYVDNDLIHLFKRHFHEGY